MRKTIVVKGKRLIYSLEYYGYIDPEWHPGVRGSSIYENRNDREQLRLSRTNEYKVLTIIFDRCNLCS